MFGVYDYWLFGLFAAFAALETLAPARVFPAIRGWRLKGIASAVLYWDMVFGTYRNPATWNGQAGFYDGASDRIGDLLIGRDVAGGERGLTPETAP